MATKTKREIVQNETAKKPVHNIHYSPVRVSIWVNEGKEGKQFYSLTWQRSYMDKEGKWQHSNSLSYNHMKVAILALQEAERWMEENPLA